MADYERTVLEHYQLPTAYPTEWPAEKDLSDASEDEEAEEEKRAKMMNRRKSRYAALDRQVSRTSVVPGAEKAGNGIENLVQKDEPDPLGSSESVVRVLKNQGLPVQDDVRLRNRFLLSSTSFSPSLFLSQVHATASTDSLLQGLDVLSQSIDQKSASLKVLVESNFERFVKAKSTIDNVYREMKSRGEDQATPASPALALRSPPNSRQVSRGSFRNSVVATSQLSPSLDHSKRKNALIKESEYGVLGIKAPLLEVAAKAEEVWGPALGGREKEENLKLVASAVDANKETYKVGNNIIDCIKRKDYDGLVEEYTKAKRMADSASRLADELVQQRTSPSEQQIQQILVTARMWNTVQNQIQDFKRDVWRRLNNVQSIAPKSNLGGQDQHMELITILLELGATDNPIWVWLLSTFEHLKNKIQVTSDRSKIEIEIMRRRLANIKKPSPEVIAGQLKLLDRTSPEGKIANMDSSNIIELWERMHTYLDQMLSPTGILGQVSEFWQTVEGFIRGETQRGLPVGIDGASRHHHTLSNQGISDLESGVVELVGMIRESISTFFSDPPVEDISLLFSPPPPMSPNPSALTPTALRDPRLAYDARNLPPPSPRLGEAFEKFAFWPPWSNSISGVHYLAKMLSLVGSGASEMATISPVVNGDGSALDGLRLLVGSARERCVTSICAAWNRDAENIKVLEDWSRSPEKKEQTKMPMYFSAFESSILSGMQKILYISDATIKTGSANIVTPPPTKLLQMVRSQFVTTLYKALSGMVENAERPVKKLDDEWVVEGPQSVSSVTAIVYGTTSSKIEADDRNVRMLLTLSNLLALRQTIVPTLTTQFENFFSVKLTEETKTIKDVLGQIDERLFRSYTRPYVEDLRSIIRNGILSPDWPPPPDTKPQEVRPYTYHALLSLVLVHTQVSTTSPPLTMRILTHLLEQLTLQLHSCFRERKTYNLSSLMQATLDIEFVAQTLTLYTTEKTGEVQGGIYAELDRGTDDAARAALQRELPEMRAVLKRLREGSRGIFGCFRKSRTGGSRREATGEKVSVNGNGNGNGTVAA